MKAGAALILAVVFAAPAWAESPSPQRAEELNDLVLQDCGSCHGMTMKGGLGSPLTAETLREIGDEALVATIMDGRPGTPMPPWKFMMSEAEALWIVRGLKGESR